jgi:hypothetical protein
MLDAQGVQIILDDIEAQYQNGLITIIEKLEKMLGEIDCHIFNHIDRQSIYADDKLSSFTRAEKMLRQLHRIERFKNKLDLFVR